MPVRMLRPLAWPLALFASVFPERALRKQRAAKWVRERWRKVVRGLERRRKAKTRRVARTAP
jgi:hypothetical protein